MLEELDTVDWSKLRDAYGSAADLPKVVRGLLAKHPETREEALEQLTMRICHQEVSVAEATPHVVPFLVELIGSPGTPGRDQILLLVAHIAQAITPSEASVPGKTPEKEHAAELAAEKEWVRESRAAAWRGIPAYELLLSDPKSFKNRIASAYTLSATAEAVQPDPPENYSEGLSGILRALRARLTGDQNASVRGTSALGLGRLARIAGEGVLSELRSALTKEKDPAVRLVIAAALSDREGSRDPSAEEVLGKAIETPDQLSRLALESPWLDSSLESFVLRVVCRQGPSKWPAFEGFAEKRLMNCTAFSSEREARPILEAVFSSRRQDWREEQLSEFQRRLLRILADNDKYWSPVSNGEIVLHRIGLPSSREGLRRFLARTS